MSPSGWEAEEVGGYSIRGTVRGHRLIPGAIGNWEFPMAPGFSGSRPFRAFEFNKRREREIAIPRRDRQRNNTSSACPTGSRKRETAVNNIKSNSRTRHALLYIYVCRLACRHSRDLPYQPWYDKPQGAIARAKQNAYAHTKCLNSQNSTNITVERKDPVPSCADK